MPTEITPRELKHRQQNGNDVQLIDIRDTDAYEEGHIPEAENIPLEELGDRTEEIDWVTDDTDEIVVACYIGETSVQAARMLEAYEGTGNATVSTMAGGYEEWSGELETGE
jgi:thiosulfate sulfurtransferase